MYSPCFLYIFHTIYLSFTICSLTFLYFTLYFPVIYLSFLNSIPCHLSILSPSFPDLFSILFYIILSIPYHSSYISISILAFLYHFYILSMLSRLLSPFSIYFRYSQYFLFVLCAFSLSCICHFSILSLSFLFLFSIFPLSVYIFSKSFIYCVYHFSILSLYFL